jgi:hypothetical protein
LIKFPSRGDCPRKIGLTAEPWTMSPVNMIKPATKRDVGIGLPLIVLNSLISKVIRSRIFKPKKPIKKQSILDTNVLKSQRSILIRVGLENAIIKCNSLRELKLLDNI